MASSDVTPTPAAGRRHRFPLVVVAWLVAGAVFTFALGAAFTPLILLSLPALGLALLLGLRAGFDRRTWAALAGAAWLPLWLAWLDRGGPGEVCTGSVEARSCSTAGNPWPWFGVGLAMVVAGLALALTPRRSVARTRLP